MSGPVSAETDARFMAAAIRLGTRELGRTWPNPAVGALIVRDDGAGPLVVGRGWTDVGGRPHAETMALAEAAARARGATCYVSLEPCSHHGRTPPCADALVAAGVARVVSALEDPNPLVGGRGHARLRSAGIEVDVGCCADLAFAVNAGHMTRVRDNRPWVTLKLAVSRDGMIAGPGGAPVAITGPRARAAAHMLRAVNDAILVGIGTVLADDPQLTCRLPGMADRSPVRVVLDGRLRMPPQARMLAGTDRTPVWLICGATAQGRQPLLDKGAAILAVPAGADGRIGMRSALETLVGQGITRVLVEGGAEVAASLVADDLVDEAVIFNGAVEIGPHGIPAGSGLAAVVSGGAYRRVDGAVFGAEPGSDTMSTYLRTR
ncbi:bifunctional diaminohydroxyphosphoribosylaminopyrimidine deaminase/5-amino-6-(5-phosphoribosylamino)uracil reductase RibD [Microbaculum marinum]|uniref:Riboflavin biosynthesis protein RibD n=1 Tax=Microbaculum marinum TaxID=1764581 RepID=A0AAW9RMZ9_9HYPH